MKYLCTLPRLNAAIASAVLMLLAGCSSNEELPTVYGRRSGPDAGDSVNGTAVLADMLANAGHSVSSRRFLSPKTAEADVIIWFPNTYSPPNEPVRQWFDQWLSRGDRTLIYVARDYNAEPDYWREVIPQMPVAQQAEGKRRQQADEASIQTRRSSGMQAKMETSWFTIEDQPKARRASSLSGPWSDGVDPARAAVHVQSRLVPTADARVLLASPEGILASRERRESHGPFDSQLIVIANGSFLLNYPLVNHEHRKLAGHLIGELPGDAQVVFLESTDPEILDEEPTAETPTGLAMFRVWPMNWILVHLGVLGAIYLLARWPIFGLPRRADDDSTADFGKHVAALGELLLRTRDRSFALARLRHYRQVTGQESSAAPADSQKKV